MNTPLITIFVRHSAGCKYEGDEFNKRCDCRKHLRWSVGGKQFRKQAGTRLWSEAEDAKRTLEDHLAGRVSTGPEDGVMLEVAIETFNREKQTQELSPRVQAAYARQLKRLQAFSEARGLYTVAQALTLENLVALRGTWATIYKSAGSRKLAQVQLKTFLRFCHNAGWILRVPVLSAIKVAEPETMPLTETEYKAILATATGRTRVLIQLMRWSGLAIRDASTLKRTDLVLQDGVHKIIRKRVKTGADLYIPIPPAVAAEVLAVLNGNPVYVFWDRQTATSSEYRHADHMAENVKKAFEAAGVVTEGHMISHRLRATFAVDLLQKGVPLEHVSKLLGHGSVTTTERHYAKWVKSRQDLLTRVVVNSW